MNFKPYLPNDLGFWSVLNGLTSAKVLDTTKGRGRWTNEGRSDQVLGCATPSTLSGQYDS